MPKFWNGAVGEAALVLGSFPGRGIRCSPIPPENATYLPIQSLPAVVTAPTYLPIQSSAGHYNGSYVHVMSLHHFQLDYVVRPTLSLRRRRRKKSDVGRLWLFFRARRLQFAAVCPHLFPLSLACFHRISPLRRARAFDRSVTGERCSTMFDRYTSYSRYI